MPYSPGVAQKMLEFAARSRNRLESGTKIPKGEGTVISGRVHGDTPEMIDYIVAKHPRFDGWSRSNAVELACEEFIENFGEEVPDDEEWNELKQLRATRIAREEARNLSARMTTDDKFVASIESQVQGAPSTTLDVWLSQIDALCDEYAGTQYTRPQTVKASIETEQNIRALQRPTT